MSKQCSHPECQDHYPPGNYGWQRCLFSSLTLAERKKILKMRGIPVLTIREFKDGCGRAS